MNLNCGEQRMGIFWDQKLNQTVTKIKINWQKKKLLFVNGSESKTVVREQNSDIQDCD